MRKLVTALCALVFSETCQPGFFRDAEKYRRQYGRSGEAH